MHRSPDEVFAAVRDADPDVLDAEGLDAFQRRIAELRAWCDARQIRATRRQRQLAAEGRAGDPRGTLARDGRQSSKDARASAERERVCTAMPGFEDALADGQVAAGHVDAIAHATRNLDDESRAEFTAEAESLLGEARATSVDSFDRACRDLARSIRARHDARAEAEELERQRRQSKVTRWVDRLTGMHLTLVEADPETDRRLWSAIQRERARLRRRSQRHRGDAPSFDRLTVDALVSAAAAGAESSRSGPPIGDRVVVHIGLGTLLEGAPKDQLCETDSGVPLPVETVRRMACSGELIPMVLDGQGVVLDQGRAKRLATTEQRLAIEAMHATCSYPACRVSVDECRIHHIDPWEHGGATDLSRMAPLCETHHHLVHEGGWSFDMSPERVGTWIRPDGTTHWTGSLLDRTAAA